HRDTLHEIVDYQAPDELISATICPCSMTNLSPKSTCSYLLLSSTATSSRLASDTSEAAGYWKSTSLNSMRTPPGSMVCGCSGSVIIGLRSSTSNMRSKDTKALISSTRAVAKPVRGAYSRVSNRAIVTTSPAFKEPVSA